VLGTAASQAVIDVATALLARDPAKGIDHIHRALDAGSDPRQFARQVVEYLRGLLLIQVGDFDPVDVPTEVSGQMRQHAASIATQELVRDIRLFNQAANDARAAWQPVLPLEIAYIESIQPLEQSPGIVPPGPGKAQARTAPPPADPSAQARPRVPGDQTAQPAKDADDLSSEDRSATQALNQSWPHILAEVRKQSPSTYGLLNSCRSRYINGHVLVLGFASDVLKNQMSKKENLALAQEAISQILEREIAVRCVINTARRATIPAEVDDDGMVAAALRDLGGEIVDVQ
jgi:DNA polymerase-3 subunit gamma/tau